MTLVKFRQSLISYLISLALTLLLFFTGLTGKADEKVYDLSFAAKNKISPTKTDTDLIQVNVTDLSLSLLDKGWNLPKTFSFALNTMSNDKEEIYCLADIFDKITTLSINNLRTFSTLQQNSIILPARVMEEKVYTFCKKKNSQEEAELLEKNLIYPQIFNGSHIPKANYVEVPPQKYAEQAELAILAPVKEGCTRKVPLLYSYKDGYLPSFPLAIAIKKLKIDLSSITFDCGKSLSFIYDGGKSMSVPIDKEGQAFIPYIDSIHNAIPNVNFEFFSSMQKDAGIERTVKTLTKNKTIVFTQALAEKKAFIKSPLQNLLPSDYADLAMTNAFLTRSFIGFYPDWAKLLFFILTITLSFFASTIKKDFFMAIAFFALLFSLTALQIFLFVQASIAPWLFAPLLFTILSWALTFISKHIVWR